MSDSTANLRRKIIRAGDLQSVVRTMKAMAAASIGQYDKSVMALADYYRTVQLGLAASVRDTAPTIPPAAQEGRSGVHPISVVVFGSDQGLVGQFNEVVVDYALVLIRALPRSPQVWAVGERVQTRLLDAGVPLTGHLTVPSSVEAIVPLIGQILLESEYRPAGNDIADLHLIYNRRATGSAFAPVDERLLPLDEDWHRTLAELRWPTQNLPEVIGGRTATARALIGEYVFVSLFRACAESLASENASRLAAMERADKNINEMLENLHGTFHRLRQSSIDDELFDVISGYEALSTDENT